MRVGYREEALEIESAQCSFKSSSEEIMKPSASAPPSSESSKLLWNEDHIAAAIGISPKRVQQLARLGILPGFKVGRNWRFDPDAIRAWIKRSGISEQV